MTQQKSIYIDLARSYLYWSMDSYLQNSLLCRKRCRGFLRSN